MPQVVTPRPTELEADVIRFQNNKEKWIAFIGLLNGRPYKFLPVSTMKTMVFYCLRG